MIAQRRRRPSRRCGPAEELGAFLRHCESDPLHSLLRLLAHTGARRSEALGLRWDDVDLSAGVVAIVRSRVRSGYKMLEVAGGKTNAARRSIDLDERTIAALKAWRRRQAEQQLKAGDAWDGDGLVFTDPLGRGLHADHVQQRFERLVAASGVRRIRMHDLRHTHATLLLKAGVPIRVVSDRLGHSNPGFTLKQYAHVLSGDGGAAARAFAALVDG